jgi:hypothetical protein
LGLLERAEAEKAMRTCDLDGTDAFEQIEEGLQMLKPGCLEG